MPRQWKVIQTVREKFTCRSCEKITQPPAPFHVIPRGRVGPSLLAMILYAKYGEHQPLNRQSERLCPRGRRPRRLDPGRSCRRRRGRAEPAHRADPPSRLRRRARSWRRHHGAATRQRQDDYRATMDPVPRDRPFAGPDPPAAAFFYSRNRAGDIPPGIWRAMPASCRPMPMPGSATRGKRSRAITEAASEHAKRNSSSKSI